MLPIDFFSEFSGFSPILEDKIAKTKHINQCSVCNRLDLQCVRMQTKQIRCLACYYVVKTHGGSKFRLGGMGPAFAIIKESGSIFYANMSTGQLMFRGSSETIQINTTEKEVVLNTVFGLKEPYMFIVFHKSNDPSSYVVNTSDYVNVSCTVPGAIEKFNGVRGFDKIRVVSVLKQLEKISGEHLGNLQEDKRSYRKKREIEEYVRCFDKLCDLGSATANERITKLESLYPGLYDVDFPATSSPEFQVMLMMVK